MQRKTINTVVKDLLLTGAGLAIGVGNALAIDLPERFKNYKNRATSDTKVIQTPDGIYCAHRYDLDSDKLADVIEMYPAFVPGMHLTEYPVSIWFNLNNDGKITNDEILINPAGDALDTGDEYWLDQPPKQPDKLHPNQKGA